MPSTYNGIGTHYYGRKNIQKRVGTCQSCGRTVELTSYDTRLWFVIVFVPIIPLGRKRIIDHCPACTRHYAVEAEKWETARQLEVSGAQEKFRTDPSAENAIAVHQQLLYFHQADQAAEFQKTLVAKFPDHAKVQAYLGAALSHLGKVKDAEPFFAHALELRPDLPEARIGVARSHLRAGKLDEARALLDFLEKPGASQLYSLEPLETLARAYQYAGRHAAALTVFAALLKELPKLGEEKWFRQLVGKSEDTSRGQPSLLPKLKFTWKRFFSIQRSPQPVAGPRLTWRSLMVLGIVLGVVAILFLIANEYIRRHRTLHIVSAFKTPALVEVRNAGLVRTTQRIVELPLPEGRYHATITGPVKQEVDFEIRGSYWSRWFDDPAWVLNVGGSAILDRVDATYLQNPQPVTHTFYFGDTFYALGGITHPFRDLPEKANVGTHYMGLDLFRQEPTALFYYFAQRKNFAEALRLAETRLRVQPDDEGLLGLYFNTVQLQNQLDRAEKFLRPGLTNRPVLVQWHRFYQSLHRDAPHDAQLAAFYDHELESEPTNSALLYLRGRVAPNRAESRTWFQRAGDADPKNPFPFFALGFDHAAMGDWPAARTFFAHACELQPKQPAFVESFNQARLALGEYAALEKELRELLAREAFHYSAAHELCDVLVAQGRNADAAEFVRQFTAVAASRAREASREPNLGLRRHLLYATKDFAALEKESAGAGLDDAYPRFTALMELGGLDDATRLFPLDSQTISNPFHYLQLAIAYRLAGRTSEAGQWQSRAATLLAAGDGDMARAAATLRSATPPTRAELDEIAVAVESKACLLAALAQLHPANRAEFAAQSRRLNVVWTFPHHLLDRATSAQP
ncbi:MAG: tetratricopeptide repeat protein [Verrucomicrobia bacterium]|nr:MAG: tetratricopeptide repeat protein [Verrucomicrobiota bacterium]